MREGTPLAFPTDTVYGVGVAVMPGCTPESLFALKGRDRKKAIPWLVADVSALDEYGDEVPTYAFDLAFAHWPGALTLVIRAKASAVPAPTPATSTSSSAHWPPFIAADGTIALRVPAHPIALALIRELGVPLATTSANLTREEPARSLATLSPKLVAHLALAIDGGTTPGLLPSTIVSCLEERPRVIREGALPSALP
jgi:tRNA threonylcarbamoyl adenosine modification protein (Sua5/YciO/YrdC/YwlC family)